ncbi:MAG: hypothetical protein FWC97_07115, partial [Treponema sp.]|nr:hypothetical protein [Treponema sp.]
MFFLPVSAAHSHFAYKPDRVFLSQLFVYVFVPLPAVPLRTLLIVVFCSNYVVCLQLCLTISTMRLYNLIIWLENSSLPDK